MKTEYSQGRRVRNAYLVREKEKRRSRDLLLLVFSLSPVVLALIVYTFIQLSVLERGYEIERMEQSLRSLEADERRLQLDVTRLSSAARIEKVASEELNMTRPSEDQVLYLETELAP